MNISLHRPLPHANGMVSQWFGENAVDYARFGLAGHNGVDYACQEGAHVLAMHAGFCEVGDDPGGYGLYVRVVGSEYATLYAHLSATFVVMGEVVKAMQCIGAVGNTGNSTGPHLHFGLRVLEMRAPAYLDYCDPAPFRDAED